MFSKIKEQLVNFISKTVGPKASSFGRILSIGIVILAVVLVAGIFRVTRTYESFEVTNTIEKNDNVSVGFLATDNGLLRYSKNGASYSVKSGKTLWNQTFEMAAPKVGESGSYFAVGDIGGNQIRIFNESGQIGSLTTPTPIADIEVAGQGVVAAVLSDTSSNYINLYDSSGDELVTIKATISNSGYPLNIALSEDGQKLVVSYVYIKAGEPATRIVFYHFGSAGQNAVDRIVETFEYDSIFPKVEFMSNTEIAAYGEQECIIYSMRSVPEVVEAIKFDSEIKSVFSNSQYIGFIFRNDAEAEHKYVLQVFTTNGRQYLKKGFDFDYQSVESSANDIILYNEYECLMVDYSGKDKFTYSFDLPIINLLPKTAKNEYILINEESILEIKLK